MLSLPSVDSLASRVFAEILLWQHDLRQPRTLCVAFAGAPKSLSVLGP